MNIYAFIPSRTSTYSPTTLRLFSYLESAKVKVVSLVGKDSIFSAFSEAYTKINPSEEDVIILCHDDIQILTDLSEFELGLKELENPKIGFIGVAGTTLLDRDSVWWNHDRWKKGLHRGLVFHGESTKTADITYYGKPGEVVVMDGLFLAAKARTLKPLLTSDPGYEGKWDFYDLHYTSEAYKSGLTNLVVPIIVMHNSRGELAGRTSWDKNRLEFIRRNNFPFRCKV